MNRVCPLCGEATYIGSLSGPCELCQNKSVFFFDVMNQFVDSDLTPDECKYAIEMSTDARKLVKELGGLALQDHNECEDTFYSCPKSPDGCSDDRQEGCNCGADSHNERVNKILKKLELA